MPPFPITLEQCGPPVFSYFISVGMDLTKFLILIGVKSMVGIRKRKSHWNVPFLQEAIRILQICIAKVDVSLSRVADGFHTSTQGKRNLSYLFCSIFKD